MTLGRTQVYEDELKNSGYEDRDSRGRLAGYGDAEVKFYKKAIYSSIKTLESEDGLDKYDMIDHVVIATAFDRHTRVDIPVTQVYANRYKTEYEAFKRGEETAAHGIPLENWPQIPEAAVLELKGIGIKTVEALAAATGDQIAKVREGAMFKKRADAYLNQTVNASKVEALEARLAAMEAAEEKKSTK